MSRFDLKVSTHLSIAWGVTLAIITLVEWNSLGREPMRPQILTPFIQREITVRENAAAAPQLVDFSEAERRKRVSNGSPHLEVAFLFNGPLFLICFFVPVFVFHGGEWLVGWLKRKIGGGPAS